MADDSHDEMTVLVNKRSSPYIMVACSILEGYGIRYIPIPGDGDASGPVGLMVQKADYEKATELIKDSGEDESPMPVHRPMNQRMLIFFIVAGVILYVIIGNVLR